PWRVSPISRAVRTASSSSISNRKGTPAVLSHAPLTLRPCGGRDGPPDVTEPASAQLTGLPAEAAICGSEAAHSRGHGPAAPCDTAVTDGGRGDETGRAVCTSSASDQVSPRGALDEHTAQQQRQRSN